MVTESYVPELMQSGVKVYRYKPGFIHSKIMMIDQSEAMIGTCNLDFRSLYLHFENTVYLNKTSSLHDMNIFLKKQLNPQLLLKIFQSGISSIGLSK